MTIVWTGLAPHPPVIVAGVGGSRCANVAKTIDGMGKLARSLLDSNPDRLVCISPHTPRPHRGIASWLGTHLEGDFGPFGAASERVCLPNDAQFVRELRAQGIEIADLRDEPLDHGALVPLHFLQGAGWTGPTAVLGLPWSNPGLLDQIGAGIARQNAQERVGVLASGDMSHCLIPGAPAGFDPIGEAFDRAFVDAVTQSEYRAAAELPAAMVTGARQDVIESCRIAWESTGYEATNGEFYSYEGPFGVGYCVMRFYRHD